MSRTQVNDQFGGQRLQTYARPIAQVEQIAQPVEDTRWKALANVFANGAGLADTMRVQKEEDDRGAAKAWAQSMTVGELGKAIKEGKMLPSQSPVFVGTAQHIYGANTHEAGMRDMTTKLTNGELKFNSTEEADQYLTEWRNTSLAGQSEYATAGFDKAYTQTRQKVLEQVTALNDAKWVENAAVQATDYLANSLIKVASSDFKGTPQEAAAELMSQYQTLRHTKTLPDSVGRQAIGDLAGRVAMAGRKDILTALLDSDMEGIGPLRSVLGSTKAATLENHATSIFDGHQRQRIDDEVLPHYRAADLGELNMAKFQAWAADETNKKYISAATIHSLERANMAALARQQDALYESRIAGVIAASEADADRRIGAALLAGALPTVLGTNKPQVLDKHGEPKDLSDKDVRDRAEKIAVRRTASMPFEQQVGFFAQNGLKNPNWEATINAAFFNLNTIGVDSNGKPRGQLNEAGKEGLELFKKLNTYGDYAKSLMPEKQFQRFDNIAFLTKMGRSVDDAAGLATAADAGAVIGSDTDKLVKKVHAQVGQIQADPFYKWDWAQKAWGDNTNANTAQMTGTLRRYATLLAHSGQYGDADSAIDAAAGFLADPKVSAKVNGTVYLRNELPTGPVSRTQEEWFGRYIDEVPKARARTLGFKDSEVRLEYDPTIQAYRGFILGMPMSNADNSLYVVTKTDIQKWYATKEQIDVTEAAARGAANVQSVKDTREGGVKASEWAKTRFNKPAAPAPVEPTLAAQFRAQPVIDFSGLKNADPSARPGVPQQGR